MNERIKEIADESGLYIAYDNRAVTDKEIEFFAESIVRECLSYAKDGDLDFMKFMIKQHFGVEE